jgi:hypothetical protein
MKLWSPRESLIGVVLAGSALLFGACGGGGSQTATAITPQEQQEAAGAQTGDKILHVIANMAVDRADNVLATVDRARVKGADTVVFSDTKATLWGTNVAVGDTWPAEMRRLYDGVKSRNMKFVFETIALGYCGGLLASDPNLATGYPVVDQPLRVTGGALQPVSTAVLANGSFEQSANNQATGWYYQDAPGERTFIDTAVAKSGGASLRAESNGGADSRIFTTFTVKPWHQYTVRLWMKTQELTANGLLVLVRANSGLRSLTSQSVSLPNADGSDRQYFSSPAALTRDWTEIKLSFNSQDQTAVDLALTVFGGSQGRIWWDDVRIEDTPTMNWLVRDDLPSSAKAADGSALTLGTDIAAPRDPQLGQISYPGRYGNYHEPTTPAVLNSGRLKEGDIVRLSGYHTLVTMSAQVGCSWNHPRVVALMRGVHEKIYNEFRPDGILLNYDEIRTGGFEPADVAYGTSGAALAASIQKAYADLDAVAPGVRHFFWSDMVDPNHNAKADFEQVANTLDGAWKTLDPAKVTLVTWWERQNITDKGPASLKFFSDLGFKQVIGAFYDEDVADNHQRWQAAMQGIPNISGSMYATWANDYSRIEPFGDLWWK